MAESSWPSPSSGRAVNDVQHEALLTSIGGDGLVGLPTDPAWVYGDSTGRQVKVRPNQYAHLRGHQWTSGTVELIKAVATNTSGQPRIDLAVLGLSRTTWDVTCYIKQGTPASVPVAPALQQDPDTTGIYEIPLATIGPLASGFTTVTAANVTAVAWYLGEPIVLCTSTTRPPHRPGMVIYETDTGKTRRSSGTSWFQVTDERNGIGELGPFKSVAVPQGTNFPDLAVWSANVPVTPGHYYNLHAYGISYAGSDNCALQSFLYAGSDSRQLGDHPMPAAGQGHGASIHLLGWKAPAGITSVLMGLKLGKLRGTGPIYLDPWDISVVHVGAGNAGA